MNLCSYGRYFEPYSPESLNNGIKKICKKYGLEEITPYMLRSSFATKCFSSGMREPIISEIMGHRLKLAVQLRNIMLKLKKKQREKR